MYSIKKMTDHIARLPSDVVKHLSGYLDYNSRVSFNTVVPLECKLIKKVNSDSHNLKVKLSLIKHKLDVIENSKDNLSVILGVIKLFSYFVKTKDNVLFELKSIHYRNIILTRIIDFQTNEDRYIDLHKDYKVVDRIRLNMIRVTSRLEKKLNDIPFHKEIKKSLVKVL